MRRAVCQRQLSYLFICVGYSSQVKYSTVRSLREIGVLVQKIDSLVHTMHKTFVSHWLFNVCSKYFPVIFRRALLRYRL